MIDLIHSFMQPDQPFYPLLAPFEIIFFQILHLSPLREISDDDHSVTIDHPTQPLATGWNQRDVGNYNTLRKC